MPQIQNSFHSHRHDLLFVFYSSFFFYFSNCFVSWILSQFSHCTLLIFTLVWMLPFCYCCYCCCFFNSSHYLLYFFFVVFASCTSYNCWIGILFHSLLLLSLFFIFIFLHFHLCHAIVNSNSHTTATENKKKCQVESI